MQVRSLRALLLALAVGPAIAAEPAPPLADFAEVWTTVRDEFFDPELRGVDWERARRTWSPHASGAGTLDELAAAINGMLATLETSHTHYYTVHDPAYWFLADLFNLEGVDDRGYVGIGLFSERVAGEDFVRSVVDGGPAAAAGLRAGDRLVAVEDGPWQPILPFRDREGRKTIVRVQRARDGEILELPVVPRRIHPVEFYRQALAESARRIARPGIDAAYVRVWSYAGRQNHDTLIQLLNSELGEADGLILDLRDGWGGASPSYLTLFSERVPSLTSHRRGAEMPTHWDSQWRKPVVLLVDRTTRSGKEILAYGFKEYGYGPVVGETTAGAALPGKLFPIGDRAMLYLAVADFLVDGERLEGTGVAPDHEVPFELPYANGEDPRLERALELLKRP
jgi:carboxyl-terminal processing protease